MGEDLEKGGMGIEASGATRFSRLSGLSHPFPLETANSLKVYTYKTCYTKSLLASKIDSTFKSIMALNSIQCHRRTPECPKRPSVSSGLPTSFGGTSDVDLAQASPPIPCYVAWDRPSSPARKQFKTTTAGLLSHVVPLVPHQNPRLCASMPLLQRPSPRFRSRGQLPPPFNIRVPWCSLMVHFPTFLLHATRDFPQPPANRQMFSLFRRPQLSQTPGLACPTLYRLSHAKTCVCAPPCGSVQRLSPRLPSHGQLPPSSNSCLWYFFPCRAQRLLPSNFLRC